MTIFRREKRRTEGNTFLNKRKRTDIRTEFLECRRTADFRAQNRVRDGQKMGEI